MTTDNRALSRRLQALLKRSDTAFEKARVLLGKHSKTPADSATLHDELERIRCEADEIIKQLRLRPTDAKPSEDRRHWQGGQ